MHACTRVCMLTWLMLYSPATVACTCHRLLLLMPVATYFAALPWCHAGVRCVHVRASEQQQQQTAPVERLQYDKILLTILDSNPYLSDGSRQVRL
jgi:hypothetical protein